MMLPFAGRVMVVARITAGQSFKSIAIITYCYERN